MAGLPGDEFGYAAERTFDDLLVSWTGTRTAASKYQLDIQKVDTECSVPSLWNQVPDIHLRWQVKAVAAPSYSVRNPLGCQCIEVRREVRQIAALAEAARHSRIYLALGVPNGNPESLKGIYDTITQERFNWYVLDLQRYFSDYPETATLGHLYVPTANRFTLGLFSLLWASTWVYSFHEPILGLASTLQADQETARKVASAWRGSDRDLGWEEGFDNLPAKLEDLNSNVAGAADQQARFILGQASMMRLISSQLRQRVGELTHVQTYCPEALGGTVAQWLCSPHYKEFMLTSADAVGAPNAMNTRYLPVDPEYANRYPFYRTALLLVRIMYELMDVRVHFVTPAKKDPGTDHADWGGLDVYFPWLEFDHDGARWLVGERDTLSYEQHRDFFSGIDANVIGLSDYRRYGHIGASDLRIDGPPTCLFPERPDILKLPTELWSPRAHALLSRWNIM